VDFVRVFPLSLEAPRQARYSLEALIGLVPPHLLIDLRIVMSEMVTNSVRHSGGSDGDPLTVRVDCSDRRIRIEVEDGGPGFSPIFQAPRPTSTKGWGLYIVDQLTDRWGVLPGGVVWAEVDIPGS
jgi:anti-sigma regulatory factor (Ser/Thr protein kinase)